MPAVRRSFTPLAAVAHIAAAALVVAGICGCVAGGGPEASRRAARADSAAAGYPIAADSTDRARDAAAAALVRRIRRALVGAPPDTMAGATIVAAAPPTPRAAPVQPARPMPAAPAARAAPTPSDAAPPSDTALTSDSGRSGPDSLLHMGEFLAWNPARRTVQLHAIAGYDGTNGSLNLNGATRGASVVVVPRDWYVEVRFRQGDESLAHSALVAPLVKPMPVDAPPPAFPHAATRRTTEGLLDGATDAFTFVADRAGEFVLQCGVPGHAQGGMWIRLVVDSAATEPRYH